MTVRRQRPPIFAADIRGLGGQVSVAPMPIRDRSEGSDFFGVSYVSKGGDLFWTSPPIPDADRADAAAAVLAAFLGAQVRR